MRHIFGRRGWCGSNGENTISGAGVQSNVTNIKMTLVARYCCDMLTAGTSLSVLLLIDER